MTAIVATCPPGPAEPTPGRRWADWHWPPDAAHLDRCFPPVRVLLVWDNLAGRTSYPLVHWCAERGICLLYTALAGSWLNMAESVQRIMSRRALAGQHPQNAQEVMAWLAAPVTGWNAVPTPFIWGGKRQQRRWRARQRRHALGGSGALTARSIPRRPRSAFERVRA